jgi:hypothetical protein
MTIVEKYESADRLGPARYKVKFFEEKETESGEKTSVLKNEKILNESDAQRNINAINDKINRLEEKKIEYQKILSDMKKLETTKEE